MNALRLIGISLVTTLAGCVTTTGQMPGTSPQASAPAAAATPSTPGCTPLGPSKQAATVGGAVIGSLIGGLIGKDMARNDSVGARNGVLLGALAGGLVGSQFGSAVKTVQMPDGSVKLDIPGSVLFASGSAAVNEDFKSTLNAISRTMRQYCDLSAVVVGHTDSVGTRQNNLDLSRNRARAVAAYLVSTGIPPGQLGADGKGQDEPVADNNTAAGRQMNRRVELIVRPPAP